MGTWSETKEHARRTLVSLTGSRAQTATAIAALSLPALLSPVGAVASAAAAGALLFARSRATRQPFAAAAGKGGRLQEQTYPIGTLEDGTPVALNAQQISSGMLVYGTTGSGRTEALLGIAEGMLAKGSGMIFIDGIGDVSLYANLFVMAAALGREDDVLVVFPASRDGTPRGHAFNSFQTGTLQQLTTFVGDLLDPVAKDNVWMARAVALTNLVLEALVFRRDSGKLSLDLGVLLDALALENVLSLSEDRDLPDVVRDRVREYVGLLPGFQPERGPKQAQTTMEQHGYVQMHAGAVLRTLEGAGIITSGGQQVDLEEVMLNDRILVVMLPSPDKSPLETTVCAKAVLGALRMAMTSMAASLTPSDPNTRSRPFPVILNDVDSGSSRALKTIATQASHLGLSMIYGFQDERSLTRRCGETGMDLIANANTTIQLGSQGDGRMNVSSKGMTQQLVALYPRALRKSVQMSAFKNSAHLDPVDLVPLTTCTAN